MLPSDKTVYCILKSGEVNECCSSTRVLPMSEQDPTPEGMCHPDMLRVEHKWSDLNDRTGLIRSAIGELNIGGFRYQDTRQGQQVGDFHADSLGGFNVLACSEPSDSGNQYLIKEEKSSGKVWLLMDTASPSEE